MAAYLIKLTFHTEGIKDSLKDGPQGRKKMVEELIAPMGGKMESFYYTFGDYGVCCISNMPDHITADALTVAINCPGVLTCSSAVLISPAGADNPDNKTLHYAFASQ